MEDNSHSNYYGHIHIHLYLYLLHQRELRYYLYYLGGGPDHYLNYTCQNDWMVELDVGIRLLMGALLQKMRVVIHDHPPPHQSSHHHIKQTVHP